MAREWREEKRGRPAKDDPKVRAPSISLPESLIEEVERLAKRLGKPRSYVYEKAIETYIAAIRSAGL